MNSHNLFSIGNNDIIIKKGKFSNQCSCHQTSFNYKHLSNVFIGPRNTFTVFRIRVFQMI